MGCKEEGRALAHPGDGRSIRWGLTSEVTGPDSTTR
jgi:hypothetical protein